LEEFDEQFDETIKRVVSDDDVSSVLTYEQTRGAMEEAGEARLQLWCQTHGAEHDGLKTQRRR
jgi:hypothetical protein